MKTTKTILISSTIFALMAAGCQKQAAQTVPPSPAPQAQQQVQNPTPAPAPNQNPDPKVQKPGGLTVYESVQGSSINKPSYLVDAGVNAFDLLKATHVVDAKDYGSMGMFVQGIDGIKPDSKHFWKLYVNGKSSNVGPSSYKLVKGDKIEWKLDGISGQ